jgi:hypothetical protein
MKSFPPINFFDLIFRSRCMKLGPCLWPCPFGPSDVSQNVHNRKSLIPTPPFLIDRVLSRILELTRALSIGYRTFLPANHLTTRRAPEIYYRRAITVLLPKAKLLDSVNEQQTSLISSSQHLTPFQPYIHLISTLVFILGRLHSCTTSCIIAFAPVRTK